MNWKTSIWLIATIATSISSQILKPILQVQQNADNNNNASNVVLKLPMPDSDERNYEVVEKDTYLEEQGPIPSNEVIILDDEYVTTPDEIVTETSTIPSVTLPNLEITTPTVEVTSPEEDVAVPSGEIEDILVETTNGPVHGYYWQESREIIAYLDIPYGKFNSNFEEPSESDSWTDPIQVKEHSKRCPQLDSEENYVGDTDCLTLSIFTPVNPVRSSVLFYIHESNFKTGSGDPAIYGPEYLVPKNVILVLPNYRLGPLGFMCLRNNTIPGNAALRDLALALDWTVNNIETFGGDPSNIAVSGDGSSAALAVYLSLSPRSKEFITKVITDSGTVLSHWAIDRDPITTTMQVFNSLSNNTNFNIDEELFSGENMKIFLTAAKDVMIRPCIDNGFLTNNTWRIMENERFDNITFMIGSANHAGLAKALQHNEESISEVEANFASILPNDLIFNNDAQRNATSETLMRQYFSDGNITMEHARTLSLYHTDASYLGPSVRTARALVEAGATVFLYEFSYVGSLNKELMNIDNAPEYGAVRGDIAGYLFTQDGRQPVTGTDEERMVEQVTELWVSFLKNGEPEYGDIVWQPMNGTAENWLDIRLEPIFQTGLHVDRLQLWTDIYRDHFIDSHNQAFLQTRPDITVVFVIFALIYFSNF